MQDQYLLWPNATCLKVKFVPYEEPKRIMLPQPSESSYYTDGDANYFVDGEGNKFIYIPA